MGLDNREYMRDKATTSSGYRGGGSSAMQDIVKTLIIVNVIVFLLQVFIKVPSLSYSEFSNELSDQNLSEEELREGYQYYQRTGQIRDVPLLNKWLTLDSDKVFEGQIWRLATYDFLHSTDSIFHIFFNMWLLFLAGRAVAARYGQKEFLWFYLLAGIFSAAFYIAWGLLNRESVAAVGASGAVSGILVLYAMNWPYHKWYIYGIIPLPVIGLVLISAGMDLFPMLQQLSNSRRVDNIAHSAHIGGMLFGFFYYKFGWRFSDIVPGKFSIGNFIRFKNKPKLKIHKPASSASYEAQPPPRQPIPPEIAKRVDGLLEKISRSGEASLTAEEREFLNESSRKYR